MSPEFIALQAAVVGRFSLEREIGRGGMGVVFLARDIALARPVAIKLLAPALAADTEARHRFVQEARTAAGLSHPNVVPIHLVEEHGDCVFFVMALVEGTTLRERVEARGPLSSSQTARLMQEVAWALSLAHARGVVHRDIKPDNVMLDKGTGRAMVTDFGIAHSRDVGDADAGKVVGTAHYMSPEQATGDAVDGRGDLYSLGVTAYYALTGAVPFDAPTMAAILAKHVTEPAPSVATARAGLPDQLVAIVGQLLEKEPARRYASAQALADAIDAAGLGEAAIPTTIRMFRASVHSVGTEFSAYALVLWLVSGWSSSKSDTVFSLDFFRMELFLVLAGLILFRVKRLWESARAILREGLEYSDVRKALAADGPEPTTMLPSAPFGKWRALFQRPIPELATGGILGYLLAGFLRAFIEFLRSTSDDGFDVTALVSAQAPRWVGLIGAAGFLLIFLSFMPFKWNGPAVRALPFWSAFWSGGVGRWFFRLAGLGLGTQKRAVKPSEGPVETMISDAAEAAFAALPAGDQARLASLPAVLSRLERQVAVLRDGPEDVARRRATAVAALEGLRLDLLRLTARERSVDDLTAAVAAAQELGDEIDRMIAARREVGVLLKRRD